MYVQMPPLVLWIRSLTLYYWSPRAETSSSAAEGLYFFLVTQVFAHLWLPIIYLGKHSLIRTALADSRCLCFMVVT